MNLQEITDRISFSYARLRHALATMHRKSGWLAHHGMQRSGTNFLRECLALCDMRIINAFDPARSNPRHKHCRWYTDKAAIPPFLAAQYGNTLVADSIHAVNAICRYPADTRHIVLHKDAVGAVASLMNFGLRCNWFATKEDALAAGPALLADYRNYYGFWEELSARHPDYVQIISYDALVTDSSALRARLETLGFTLGALPDRFVFSEVRVSPTGRSKLVSADDVRAAIPELRPMPV